jgi:hypothetical protein
VPSVLSFYDEEEQKNRQNSDQDAITLDAFQFSVAPTEKRRMSSGRI